MSRALTLPAVAPVMRSAPWGVAVALVAALTLWRAWLVPHLGITLFIDEAQYWDWSRHLAWGYYSKPPVIAALIAASTAVAGDGVLGVKWLSLLLHPLAAAVLARLAFEMGGSRAAVWALLLAATAPLSGLLGLFATTDAPLLLAWALAGWTLWRALQTGSVGRWSLFGVVCALGLLSKYTMAAFAPTVLVALVLEWHSPLRARHLRGALVALGVVALLMLPHLVWNYAHGWPTLQHTAEITVEAQRGTQQSAFVSWVEFTLAQALVIGPVTAGLIATLLWRARRRRSDANAAPMAAAPIASARHFAAAMALPLLVVGMAQAAASHANINWAAPALWGGVLWLSLHAAQLSWRALTAACGVNVLLAALVLHAPDIARAIDRPLPRGLDAFSRMRGWDTAFERLHPEVSGVSRAQGETLLIASNRAMVVHAAYHWRDLPLRIVVWNPDGRQHNHYGLTTRLPPPDDPLARQTVMVLADEPSAGGALAALRDASPAGDVEIATGDRRTVRLFLWRVNGLASTHKDAP